MPEISLTSFVDFVVANGPSQATKVRDIKKQMEEEYSPAADFYKGVREGIIDLHRNGLGPSYLDEVVEEAHEKKQPHYEEIVAGYRKFLRGKKVAGFAPRSSEWAHGELTIDVNPELGLKFNGTPHLIKLYFKSEKLSKRRSLHLMRLALPRSNVGLLDTRRGRLHVADSHLDPMLEAYVRGQAAAFVEIWRQLPE